MSSRSLNKVLLIGNLTRDPELRYTPKGTPVCTFGLATNRSWVPATGGERQEEAEFHRIVAWNKLAELCAQLLFKGRKVYVEGRLQTRTWTGSDGQERTTTEAVIDNMIVLDSKRKAGEEIVGEGFGQAVTRPAGATMAATVAVKSAKAKPSIKPSPAPSDDTSFGPKAKSGKAVNDNKKSKAGLGSKAGKKTDEKKASSKVEKKTEGVGKSNDKEEVKADDIPF